MQQTPGEFYGRQSEALSSEIKQLRQQLLFAAMARLATFIMLLVAGYFFISFTSAAWLFALVGSTLLFILSLNFFFRRRAEKSFKEKLLFLTTNELDLLEGEPNQFPDGEDLENGAVYATDLDIAGYFSLHHHLNRTTTSHGNAALSHMLNHPLTTRLQIEEHQSAIATLAPQVAERQRMTVRGLLNTGADADMQEIAGWMSTPSRLYHKQWLNILRMILPLVNILAFIYYLATDNLVPIGAGIFISWLIIGLFVKHIQRQHAMLGRKQSVLQQYSSILHEFTHIDTADSSLLARLSATAIEGTFQIRKLSRLTSYFDQRLNMLVNIFLNSFFLYDIHCMIALEKWKEKNKGGFDSWINTTGQAEMLVSFATFAFNNPNYCRPVIEDGEPCIRATAMAHPLIEKDEAVVNDFVIGERENLILVSGSNMSGKSTFLRTVGVNLLLAQCGAPVCATSFSFTPMQILSSIRINDSLQDHTSYFMAELKRLRHIIAVLESGTTALVLIDEVLRGTNSDDKTHGSEALIRKLLQFRCITFFATHDLSLSRLEDEFPGKVGNYCFESRIEQGELIFDYRLREGVAKNKNATFLMQKMGIIAS